MHPHWLAGIALVAACSKTEDVPSCAAVADSMIAVTKQMGDHGGMEMINRKATIDQCEARNMPADQRRCLIAAKDTTAISTCMTAHRPDTTK